MDDTDGHDGSAPSTPLRSRQHLQGFPGGLHGSESVVQKARLKPGTSIAVVNPQPSVVESLGLSDDTAFVEPADAQLVLVFVSTRDELEALVPTTVAELAGGASMWVLYRKGSRSAGLDMSRDDVWAVAERLDMRPLGLLSVDETWSAFRLRPS